MRTRCLYGSSVIFIDLKQQQNNPVCIPSAHGSGAFGLGQQSKTYGRLLSERPLSTQSLLDSSAMMPGAAVAPMVPPAAGAQCVSEPMAPASPAHKRPRHREQAAAPAMAHDVTLPQLVSEVANLYARFARDETFVSRRRPRATGSSRSRWAFGRILRRR